MNTKWNFMFAKRESDKEKMELPRIKTKFYIELFA